MTLAHSRLDWGNVPAWVGLVIGLATVVGGFVSYWGRRRAIALSVYAVVTKFSRSNPPKDTDYTNYCIANTGARLIREVQISAWETGKRRWFWRFRNGRAWMTGERLEGRLHHAVEPGTSVEGDDMTAPKLWSANLRSPAPLLMLVFEERRRRWVLWPDGRLNRVHRLRWGPGFVAQFRSRVVATLKKWANPPADA